MGKRIIFLVTDLFIKNVTERHLKLCFILLIALGVRIVCLLYYTVYLEIRTFEYEKVAFNLIQGNGFMFEFLDNQYRAGIAPVFPVLCAFIYLIFGHNQILILLLQIALSTATCAIVFFITEKFLNSECAYLSAILSALHPSMIIYSSTMLHSVSLYSFLICSSLFLMMVSIESHGLRHNILLGFCTGLCVLERATFLPFYVLGWFWILHYSMDKKKAKSVILSSIVALFLIVTPWVIRNTIIFKQFVFIQTNQWVGLWIGNNPQSWGTPMMYSGKTWEDSIPDDLRKKLKSLDEIGQMELFKAEALTFIRQHPSQFIERTIKKLYYFWWFPPSAGLLYPASYRIIYKIYYTVILTGAIIGLIWALTVKKVRPIIILVLLLFSSYSLLHSFYYLEGRHRFSIEPILLICFSLGAFKVFRLINVSRLSRELHWKKQ
ncbi:MAG: glycosyltransferase family 39 protein [Nitrospirae bacterium]|nr:glycosyltransferase family 39 protein [Nitrospirota bacterium]